MLFLRLVDEPGGVLDLDLVLCCLWRWVESVLLRCLLGGSGLCWRLLEGPEVQLQLRRVLAEAGGLIMALASSGASRVPLMAVRQQGWKSRRGSPQTLVAGRGALCGWTRTGSL